MAPTPLTGGAGRDTFVWTDVEETADNSWYADIITDFSTAQRDRISLTAIDADTTTSGDQAFRYIAGAAFSGAGQVRSYSESGYTYLALNTDRNLDTVEGVIRLDGTPRLSSASFLL